MTIEDELRRAYLAWKRAQVVLFEADSSAEWDRTEPAEQDCWALYMAVRDKALGLGMCPADITLAIHPVTLPGEWHP